MAIPLSQLNTWSTRPDPSRSADTYDAVKNALASWSPLQEYTYDVYLQGSYANATNIRADSDVDVVVELTSLFRNDISALSVLERISFDQSFLNATRTLEDFRRDVLVGLRSYFNWGSVSEGNKCIKVAGSGRRLPADVLVAQEYRRWWSFRTPNDYYSGIVFTTRDGREVINYPRQHRTNGETKHGNTGGRYKRLVRTVKNARRKLVEDGKLTREDSPSYFVECLLYNIPDSEFWGELDQTYRSALVWLGENAGSLSGLLCQNEITSLFGNEPEQWDTWRAERLIVTLLQQWADWGK